jgi:small subunit ribosomal protein S6
MRVYETTFILSPQADDAAFDRQIKAVSELITRYKGKVLEEDRWGIRRLAYAIRKFTQGYYTRIVFKGNNTLLRELDRFYRLEEPYIRDLTVSFEGKLEEKETDEQPKTPPAVVKEKSETPNKVTLDTETPTENSKEEKPAETDQSETTPETEKSDDQI